MPGRRLVDLLHVQPGHQAGLAARDPGDRLGFADKEAGLERHAELVARISLLHNRLRAEAPRSLLVVLQGLDASGKDGTISHVFTGISPQGCRVVSFRQPTATELAHDYLWRVHAQCPARGELVIFNRSHYEDVVAVRVRGLVPKHVWSKRYRHIREFERLLTDEGRPSSRSSSTSRRPSRASGCRRASTTRRRRGSSAPATSPIGRNGATSSRPTRMP